MFSPSVQFKQSEPPPTPASASTTTATVADELAANRLSVADAISKKQQKKDARKAEKAARRERHHHLAEPDAEEDPFAANYGDVPAEELQSKAVSGRLWTRVGDIAGEARGGVRNRREHDLGVVESFSYGVRPHGGFGVVMLFCALSNIRMTSLFPRSCSSRDLPAPHCQA